MNWRDLFLCMFTLTQAQNIPSIQTYADDWAKLADDFEAIGLTETARNCRARFEQYRILTACPNCGHDPDDLTVQVNRETVTDHFETWLARPSGKRPVRITERIPVLIVNGASHHDRRRAQERVRELEKLEARQRAEGMVPIHEADPAGTVARRRRPAAESRRQPGRG
jgi:uncharacterized protein YbaR (Trm112 family)